MKTEGLSKNELIEQNKALRSKIADLERTLNIMNQGLEGLSDADDFGDLVEVFDDPTANAKTQVATQSIHMAALMNQDVTSSGSFDLREMHRNSWGHLLDAIPIPALTVDTSAEIAFINTGFAYITDNYRSLEGSAFTRLFPNESTASKADSLIKSVLEDRRQRVVEGVIKVDQRHLWARIHLRSLRTGPLRYVMVLIQDLTTEKKLLLLNQEYQKELEQRVLNRTSELKVTNAALKSEVEHRRKVQEALKESERRYRALFDHCPVALWVEDASEIKRLLDNFVEAPHMIQESDFSIPAQRLSQTQISPKILEANQAMRKLLGFDAVNGGMKPLQDYYQRTSLCSDMEKILALAKGQATYEGECEFESAEGSEVHAALKWSVLPGYEKTYARTLVSIIDITDRKQAENNIRKSLQEKEALLREIHHRVKNNLQVISSLLRLQSTYMRDESVAKVFEETEQRVRSMALAHEQLYRSKDLSELDLCHYLGNLIETLTETSDTIGRKISVHTDLDHIKTSVDIALPLGCIVNELFSNCMKHAFPEEPQGQIDISLKRLPGNQIRLIITDDGVGLKKNVNLDKPESLGMDLIGAFTDQLRGSIEFNSEKGGTAVTLTFQFNS